MGLALADVGGPLEAWEAAIRGLVLFVPLQSKLFGLLELVTSCWCCWANLLASKLVSSNALSGFVVLLLAIPSLFEKSILCC